MRNHLYNQASNWKSKKDLSEPLKPFRNHLYDQVSIGLITHDFSPTNSPSTITSDSCLLFPPWIFSLHCIFSSTATFIHYATHMCMKNYRIHYFLFMEELWMDTERLSRSKMNLHKRMILTSTQKFKTLSLRIFFLYVTQFLYFYTGMTLIIKLTFLLIILSACLHKIPKIHLLL